MRQDLAERMRMSSSALCRIVDEMVLDVGLALYSIIGVLAISGKGQAPEKVTATDLFYLRSMDRGAANVPYLLAQYLVRHAKRRNSGAVLSELPLINMGELVKLKIYMEIRDNWAWVSPGQERQQFATAGAPGAAKDAPAIDEGVQGDPIPMHAPTIHHHTSSAVGLWAIEIGILWRIAMGLR
ncbi:hypothetical protein Tco_1263207 [Tanacetum coccineum]